MANSRNQETQDIILYVDSNTISIKASSSLNSKVEKVENFDSSKSIHEIIDWIGEHQMNFVLVATDPNAALDNIKTQIKLIQAGGGIVQNPKGEYLFIYRRGKWDLPKGKKEDFEDDQTCAIREVEEETGVKGLQDTSKLCNTYHIYREDGQMVLKETFWYLMKAQNQVLIPQKEEGIKKAEWLPQSQLRRIYANTYPSVKYLVSNFIDEKTGYIR